MNKRTFAAPVMAAASLFALPAGLATAGSLDAPVIPGQVIASAGTPNLWVADDQGVLHFVSDPQVLADKPVNWSARVDVSTAEIATIPRGNPWLSAPLVQADNGIFLPQATPGAFTLRHIASVEDLALIGVSADNYGEFVLGQPVWETLFNTSLDQLKVGDEFHVGAVAVPSSSTPEIETEDRESTRASEMSETSS